MNDLVSIIITTRNRKDLLPRALNSAINQSYKNIEIIVVDDCSSDNTEQIVNGYLRRNNKIKYIKNDTPSGANISRNKGILASNGKFIAGLDDDDEFMPNRIELLLNNYDDTYAFITSNNIIINNQFFYITNYKPYVSINDMLYDNCIDNQGLILKTRLLNVGLYDEKLTACQDYDMWMKLIIQYGDIKTIKESTQIIYKNAAIQSISSKSRKKYYGYFKFYKRYKYLMNDYHKKAHLIRIYDIKSKNNIQQELVIKILQNKIKNSGIKKFSIFGINIISIQIIKFLTNNNIEINYLIDSYKKGLLIGNLYVESLEDVINKENNFIICSFERSQHMKEILYKYKNKNDLNLISM